LQAVAFIAAISHMVLHKSHILIWWFYSYYQCWKQLCYLLFFGKFRILWWSVQMKMIYLE